MKRLLSLIVTLAVLTMAVGMALAESADATATPDPTAAEPCVVGTVTATDTAAMTMTVNGVFQAAADLQADATQAADATATADPNASASPDAKAADSDVQPQAVVFAINDSTVFLAEDGTTALTFADMTVSTPVSVTYEGNETDGYTALTVQVMPAQPTDTAAADATATAAPASK